MNNLRSISDSSGVYTAIVTPFKEDSSGIDYESVDNMIRMQIDAGVTGVVIAGSTGEAATLSDVEYGAIIRYIVDRSEGKLICIAGVNSSSTTKAVELASRAADSGVSKLLVVSPPYNKPTQQGIIAHFEAIKSAANCEIMAYNVPGRAVSSISAATLKILFDTGTITSIKESSGSVDNAIDIMTACPQIAFFSGDDSLAMPHIALGAKGLVSVASNVVPAAICRLCNSSLAGDFQTARTEHFRLMPLIRALFAESNPIPVKAALKIRGIISHASLRLPLTKASDNTYSLLTGLL